MNTVAPASNELNFAVGLIDNIGISFFLGRLPYGGNGELFLRRTNRRRAANHTVECRPCLGTRFSKDYAERFHRGQETKCWEFLPEVLADKVRCNVAPKKIVMTDRNPPPLSLEPQQRRVLITGVTRGLGRAMADEFVRLGHIVIGCGRSGKVIEELRLKHGRVHRFDAVDVTNDRDVHAWATDVIPSHGVPNLLVNNAGLINRNALLWNIQAEDFDSIIDVNIKGVANIIRHFASAMVKAGTGVIVNVSSGWGRETSPEVAPYCASKWAIEGLTRALAQEIPKDMAAISLDPGVIDTDMLRSCYGDAASKYPSPEVWAKRAVPFLLRLGAKDNGKPVTVM